VYTDGNKIGDSVGAAGIIFVNSKLVHQLKFKPHGQCTNFQADQTSIFEVLEKLVELQYGQGNEKWIAIYTVSEITLDLQQNNFKQNQLIELIRNMTIALTHLKWIMHFGWVKRHTEIERNELVDRLAKEASVEDGPVV
jgi:ribonuclease HI